MVTKRVVKEVKEVKAVEEVEEVEAVEVEEKAVVQAECTNCPWRGPYLNEVCPLCGHTIAQVAEEEVTHV